MEGLVIVGQRQMYVVLVGAYVIKIDVGVRGGISSVEGLMERWSIRHPVAVTPNSDVM